MKRLLYAAFALSAWSGIAPAAGPDYPELVGSWAAFSPPPRTARADYAVWSQAANFSPHSWIVSSGPAGVVARLAPRQGGAGAQAMPFVPKADRYEGAHSAVRVSDGWLVGFNQGEFGAALYWFSETGKQHYVVSRDQVVGFVSQPKRLLAIEGLAHLSLSRGSIVEIRQLDGRWRTHTVAVLPFAPHAAVVEPDGQLLVVLSDALVRLTSHDRILTLLDDVPWRTLFPTSAALQSDGKVLYVGLRQFVAEIALPARAVRLLAPDRTFIHRLPASEEARIRAQFGG